MLCDDLGKTAAQRRVLPGQLDHLFVDISGEAVSAGTASLSDTAIPDSISLRRKLKNPDLVCSKVFEQVVIGAPKTQERRKAVFSLCPFTTSENFPKTKRDLYTTGFYSRDYRAVSLLSSLTRLKSAVLARPEHCVEADIESSAKSTAEVPIGDDVTRNEVADLTRRPRTYRCMEG